MTTVNGTHPAPNGSTPHATTATLNGFDVSPAERPAESYFQSWQRSGLANLKPPVTHPSTIDLVVVICDREMILFLHDTDDMRLLARVETILNKYPGVPSLPAPAAMPEPADQPQSKPHWCAVHQCVMSLKRGKNGDTWYSHQRDTGGWCRGTDKA